MKKYLLGLLTGILLASSVSVFAASGRMIEVFDLVKHVVVDNVEQPFSKNNAPFVYNGTTYVPLRFIADSLGEPITWNSDSGTIYIGGDSVEQNTTQSKIIGTWEGTYENSTGLQGITLKIYYNKNGELEGKVNFYPVSTNLRGENGSYLVSIDYNTDTDVIQLTGKQIIELPAVWSMADFTAVVSENSIEGHMKNIPDREFNLKKIK